MNSIEAIPIRKPVEQYKKVGFMNRTPKAREFAVAGTLRPGNCDTPLFGLEVGLGGGVHEKGHRVPVAFFLDCQNEPNHFVACQPPVG